MNIRLNIKNKLISYFGMVLIISLFINTLVSNELYRLTIEKETMAHLSRLTEEIVDKMNLVLDEKKKQLEAIAVIPEIIDEQVDINKKKEVLEYLYNFFEFEDIIFVDQIGNTYSVNESMQDITDEVLNQILKETISVVPLGTSKINVFSINIPIIKDQQEVVGVLIGISQLEKIVNQFVKFANMDGYMLLETTGKVIAHSNQDALAYQMPMESMQYYSEFSEIYEVYKEMIAGNRDVIKCKEPETGKSNYLSYAPIKTGWSIAIIKERQTVLSILGAIDAKIILLIMVLIILSMVFIHQVLKRFTKNLNKLLECLNKIACGEVDTPIPKELLELTDEVGDTARAVQNMQVGIDEMLGTIKECTNYMNEQMEDLTEEVINSLKEALEVNGFDMFDEECKKDIITMIHTLSRMDEMMPTVKFFNIRNRVK
ncbi:MAG: cache domain-containing protein [Cellulosilyticum sp.]|nr:cache domain-containing protein [Cellulosilyticum sp.]